MIRYIYIGSVARDSIWISKSSVTWGIIVSISVSRCTCRRTSKCRHFAAGNNYFANLVSTKIRELLNPVPTSILALQFLEWFRFAGSTTAIVDILNQIDQLTPMV